MAKLTLDGQVISLDNAFEQLTRNTLSGSKSFVVRAGEAFPTIPTLTSDTFTTMSLTTDLNVTIPVVGTYSHIRDFSTNYRETDCVYSYTIILDNEVSA